jgi:hypothetical protein
LRGLDYTLAELGLLRLSPNPSARLGHLAFESQGTFLSQCLMPTARVIKTVDILKDSGFCLSAGFPRPAPDYLSLYDLEKDKEDQKTVWGTVFST